jgi:hypothetical protein
MQTRRDEHGQPPDVAGDWRALVGARLLLPALEKAAGAVLAPCRSALPGAAAGAAGGRSVSNGSDTQQPDPGRSTLLHPPLVSTIPTASPPPSFATTGALAEGPLRQFACAGST